MNDLNPRALPGGNNPPAYDPAVLADQSAKVDDFNAAAKAWLDLGEITSQTQAEQLTDFVSGARKLWRQIDETRKAEKKPHDDRAQEVQDAYNPLLATVKRQTDKVKPLQEAWVAKLENAEKLRLAALKAEADLRAKEAEEAAKKAAAGNDVAAEVEAETLAKEATKLAKQAAKAPEVKVASASGAGRTMSVRKIRDVAITNPLKVFMRYRDRPEVLDVLQRLAIAEVRAATWPEDGKIDGADITTRTIVA